MNHKENSIKSKESLNKNRGSHEAWKTRFIRMDSIEIVLEGILKILKEFCMMNVGHIETIFQH